MPDKDPVLTPEQVAKRLHISRLTVGNWLRSGKLKGLKVGRLWRVREGDLEAFLKGGIRASNPPSEEEPITKVVFRKWYGEGGGILALFPEMPADIYGHTCGSYEHIGSTEGRIMPCASARPGPRPLASMRTSRKNLRLSATIFLW